ncbi:hypothetical protein IscW_ISCW005534, partial [Ixodes scapularis]
FEVPVITARTVGKNEMALITLQNTYLPFTIYYRRFEVRRCPSNPKSQQCQTCLQLGHRTGFCLKKGKLTMCDIYDKKKKNNKKTRISDISHNCVPYCVICRNDHPSKDPHCPAN